MSGNASVLGELAEVIQSGDPLVAPQSHWVPYDQMLFELGAWHPTCSPQSIDSHRIQNPGSRPQ
jgi:hypothetical protein